MANADFSQNNKQTAPGGFDAGSYREKAKPEQTVKLTPRQQKLLRLQTAQVFFDNVFGAAVNDVRH